MLGIHFHLDASKANPATQSLTLPHATPTRKPGTIPVTKVPDRPAVRDPKGSPTSFTEAVKDPKDPFPTLPPPQEEGSHLSQTEVHARNGTSKTTPSQPTKTGATGGATTTTGASPVSPTPSRSSPTPSEARASRDAATEQLPLQRHSFSLFMKARQSALLGPLVDPFDEAQANFVQGAEEAAERLGVRADKSTLPGDKDPQFCDDALGQVNAYMRHMALRRAHLAAMEEAHRHSSAIALQAVSDRLRNMTAIFKDQQDKLKRYDLALKAEKQKTKESQAQTERLKSLMSEQAKDLKRAKANSSSLSNTIVDKNSKLKLWQRSFRNLQMEVADLHSDRLERARTDPESMSTARPIRMNPYPPPQPTTDEEDDGDDNGETVPVLTPSQVQAIEQSRGLTLSSTPERSTTESRATISTANVPQVSQTTWGSEAVVETHDSRLAALEQRLASWMSGAPPPPPPPLPPPRFQYRPRYWAPPSLIPAPTPRPTMSTPREQLLSGSIWDGVDSSARILPSNLPVGTIIRPVVSRIPSATPAKPVPSLQLRADDSWIQPSSTAIQPAGRDSTPPLDLSTGDGTVLQEQEEDMDFEILSTEHCFADNIAIEVESSLSTATRHTSETGETSDTLLYLTPTQSDAEVVLSDTPDAPMVTVEDKPSSPPHAQPDKTDGDGGAGPPPPQPTKTEDEGEPAPPPIQSDKTEGEGEAVPPPEPPDG